MSRLRQTLLLMPAAVSGGVAMTMNDHLIGRALKDSIPLPDSMRNQPGVILFASPTCAPCHKELEEFVSAPDRPQIPFLVVARALETEALQRFQEKYGETVTILPVHDELLDHQIEIKRYPTIVAIDANSVIRHVGRPISRVAETLLKESGAVHV